MSVNTKDAAAGALFIVLGAIFGLNAWYNMPLGTALNMGPGYFPLLLSGILVALGLIIAARAIGEAREAWGNTPWRGLALVLPGPALFGALVPRLGFVPALALLVLLAAYASRRMTYRLAAVVVGSLVLFCVTIFHLVMGVPFQLFGPWLGF